MGMAQTTLEVPVVKGTNAVLCLTEEAQQGGSQLNELCIHCGFCVQVCPMQLQPLYLYQAAMIEETGMMAAFSLLDCIECGCCSYICPGKIPLVQWIRRGKQLIREAKS